MNETTETIIKIGVGAAIVWMFVIGYCALIIARSFHNGLRVADDIRRLMIAWYQDWFDSTFEEDIEGRETEPETRAETSAPSTGVSRPVAPARSPADAAGGKAVDTPPGSPTRRPTKEVFVRRSHV